MNNRTFGVYEQTAISVNAAANKANSDGDCHVDCHVDDSCVPTIFDTVKVEAECKCEAAESATTSAKAITFCAVDKAIHASSMSAEITA